MKRIKKLAALILALVMVISMALAVPVFAAAEYKTRVLNVNLTAIINDGKTWNGPCGAFALAYCMTIRDGQYHSYADYYNENSGALWGNGGYTGYFPSDKSSAFMKLFSEINAGRPVIARVNSLSSSGSQHYVTVVGYENVTSEDSLTNKNFKIIDPNTPSTGIQNMSSAGYDLKAVNGVYQIVYDSKARASVGFQTEELQCAHSYQTINKSDGSYVGRCSKCSYEYPIQVSSSGAGKYQVTESSSLCTYPYQDSKTNTKVTVGDVLTITGSTVNAYKNTWYKLSSGLWVFSGHVAYKEALPSYYLNVNGILDGTLKDNTSGYGTFDVYINGSLVANDVNDYWKQWTEGTSYEVKDIKTKSGHSYGGVQGNLSGTITKYTEVNLKYNSTSSSLSVSYYVDCDYIIQLPNRVVPLYRNVTDTTQFDYYSFGPSLYIYQYAVMNDGTIRYKVTAKSTSNNGQVTDMWFTEASDMTITDNSQYELYVHTGSGGTFDVYIDGSRVADNVSYHWEYYSAGTAYEIKDIRAADGKVYSGVQGDSLTGTLNQDKDISLLFNTLYFELRIDGILDGYWTDSTSGYGTFDVYINDSLVSNDVSNFTNTYPSGTTYQITDITTKSGYTYDGVYSGTLWGTLSADMEVDLIFNKKSTRGESTVSISDGLYKLSPQCAPGYCLDSSNGEAVEGNNVVINASSGHFSQIFYIRNLGNGYYSLSAGNSGKMLDMLNGDTVAGTNVQLWGDNGTTAQQWAIYDGGNGYYIFAPKGNTNLSLDVYLAGSSDGTNVHAEMENGTNAQRWKLTAVSGYSYYLDNSGNATITGYVGNGGDITIPSSLDGHPVTGIGSYVFYGFGSKLRSVTIPYGVLLIGSYAFADCWLTNVTIPSSVTSIEDGAFSYCYDLTNITLPQSVTYIASHVFKGCSKLSSISVDSENLYYTSVDGVLYNTAMSVLVSYPAKRTGESYTIPNGVMEIIAGAFSESGLKSITIPTSVQRIGGSAFNRCDSLADVYYAGTQTAWDEITIENSNTPLTSATIHFANPVTITGLSANKTTAKPGDSITWTASASGGTGSLQYCFYIFKDGTAIQKGNYGSARTVTFTASVAGTYTARVYVKDSSSSTAVNLTGGKVTVSAPAVTIGSLTANKTTGKPGDSITWTASASGGTGTLQYCFYIFKDGTVVQRGDYGSARTVTFVASMAGEYTARVYVKDGSGTAVNLTGGKVTISAPAITIGSLTANKTTAKPGDSITWTASASGGTGTLQYCFYIFKDGTAIQKGSYGSARTVTFVASAAGTYTARVYVKDSSGTAVNLTGGKVTVAGSPLSIGSITANTASVAPGATITWTATASGGAGTLQYCFYIFKDGKILERGSYGTARTYSYKATAAGTYTARVYVKDASGTAVNKMSGNTVVAAAITISSVKPSVSSTLHGNAVTWTATASGGAGSLQYCFYVFKDGKVVQRGAYGTARTFTYTPATAGKYTVRVYVKDSAGTVATLDNAAAVTVS